MRKMFSEKQIKKMSIEGVATGLGDNEPSLYQGIVDNVNDAIESGDIQVSGGGTLYVHNIRISKGYSPTFSFVVFMTVYSSEPTAISTLAAFQQFLVDKGADSEKYFIANGFWLNDSKTRTILAAWTMPNNALIHLIYSTNDGAKVEDDYITKTDTSYTFNDFVYRA